MWSEIENDKPVGADGPLHLSACCCSIEIGEGLLASIAVTAGSAVFNAVVIPAVVILTVTMVGLTDGRKVPRIEVGSETVLRDGFFLVVSEAILIWVLGYSVLSWGSALILIGSYSAYVAYLFGQHRRGQDETEDDGDDDEEEEEEDAAIPTSRLRLWLTFDFINLFYKGQEFTDKIAWRVLLLAIATLAGACWLLAEAVVWAADALHIPVYFSSVILAAAATSVPDTVLSVKSARKGDYDNALSNALGSNIFDITICLGVPLLLYALLFGAIDLSGLGAMEDQVQTLRIVLFGVTVLVTWLFLIVREVGKGSALLLLSIYGLWLAWIADEAFSLGWSKAISSFVG